MAIVGDAYVMIHAITSGIDKDIKDGFKDVDKHGENAGERVGKSYQKGLRRGSSGKGIDWKKFEKESIKASEKFSSLTRTGYTLAPLLQAAAGTIGVLGTSLISLGSIIGAVALPAMTVLGGAMMSLAQAAITVKLAFAGVGKAISAGNKASKAGAGNAKALEKANKALIRAQRALAKAYEDAAKSELRAKRDLIDAENELHKAREQAIEDLQQLGFDSEDAAIAEQRAGIELEKARETLARVSDLPPNSRARKEAELAFAEADLNYRRAIDKNNDLKKTEAKNAAMGSFKQQVDGQESVVSAIRAVTDAEDGLKETKLENARAILSATENRDDAAEAVKDVKENKAATDAYADALKDLSPEAQRFVKYIVSLKDEFKKLKAFAGKDLFPLLEKAIDNLVKNLFPKLGPLLQGTGKALGEVALGFSKTITKAENLKRLEAIWKTNDKLLVNFGKAASNLYEVFLILLTAAKPLIDAFGNWLVKITGAWKTTLLADEATGKLANRFKIAQGIFKDLGTIFGNVFGGLGKLFEANTGPGSGGQIFLNYFKDITEKFKNLKTIDGKPLKEFFAGAAENGTLLLDLLGKILYGFIKMADDPALGIFYKNIGDAVDILNTIDLGGAMIAISELAIEFAKFIKIVTDSGSIEIFFGVLTASLKQLNKFLLSDLGQNILKTSAKILPLLAAFGFIAKIGGFAFKVVVGGVSKFVKLFTNIPNLIRGVITLLADMAAKVGLALGPFVAIVAAAAAFIAILVGAYTQSEKFRNSIAELGTFIKEKVLANFEKIKKAIDDAFGGGAGAGMASFKEALKNIGDFIATYVMPYLQILVGFIIDVLGGAITGLIYIFAAVKDAFVVVFNILTGLFRIFTGDFEGAGRAFRTAFGGLVSFFENIFKAIWAVIQPFVGVLMAVLSPIWNVLRTGLELAWRGIQVVWDLLVAGVRAYIRAITTVISVVWNVLRTGLELAWRGIQVVWDLLVAGVRLYIDGVTRIISVVWNILTTGLELAWAGIQRVWGIIRTGVEGFITRLRNTLGNVWGALRTGLNTVWAGIQTVWTRIITFITGIRARIASAAAGVWNGLTTGLQTVINIIISGINIIIRAINRIKIPSIGIGALKTPAVGFNLATIPPVKLAEGGVVRPTRNGTFAQLAEAGKSERVEPLDADGLSVRDRAIIAELSGGGKGTTINMVVNPSADMDERELAAIVSRQIAFQLRRGAA